ncbi:MULTISPECIES: DnaT-like ssDNA-binding domain-containing protein [Enterobacter cloacae complex]|uniref:DnaT-like ssDNA-binding domain-containing protein n=1 Tax=Enterobacter cloacae complex TaxID=354276 RepID=UPI000F8205D7|nr:DnaT-like ssDNA-binding domain-containing protein [Enterobacter hormaechei]KAA0884605.1 DNA-binding protein [Enterobacter hormaechei]MBE8858706.1 DNA-binding protein [Enterobacter hormaechei]MCL1419501.1 DnaT-like ssDNA-binding domain-containing protein [Enterobacter hormaechei]MCL1424694.1 DnaT-like ssDNA-binding domain-containing protein [Enterobacter hormaechei]MCM8488210.1 DnaT-like ssDNA-binding domain-containing protein [Enterobacter hormaechei]
MSIDAMRWAKKVKTGKSSSKAILTWLADMCGADLCAYPSVAALAEATEMDRKTVLAGLKHLQEIGLVVDTGERRGRTKQIPVYKLVGVEESIPDAEQTQNRNSLKDPKNGTVDLNRTENGTVNINSAINGTVSGNKGTKNGIVNRSDFNQRVPFFPLNSPKNGTRNLPRNHKDLNPTHTELVEPVIPNYPDQPGIGIGQQQPFGKFRMFEDWKPTADFARQANLWGMPLKAGINIEAELSSFIAYWQAEGKVFHQIQWEQKFARHLDRAKVLKAPQTGGTENASVRPQPAASRVVQQIQSAHAEWRRRNGLDGDGDSVAVMAGDGGNLLEPLDAEEWGRTHGPVDSSNRFDD